jgi:asparagine synthase (glutamine-hydrolysing)
MGFPTPITEFTQHHARAFVRDVFGSKEARSREVVNNAVVLRKLDAEPRFGRKIWGLLSLELWQQEFHDREAHYKQLVGAGAAPSRDSVSSRI